MFSTNFKRKMMTRPRARFKEHVNVQSERDFEME